MDESHSAVWDYDHNDILIAELILSAVLDNVPAA